MRKALLLIILPVFLMSCAQMGIKAPETIQDRINMSKATLTGMNDSVTQLLQAGLISKKDAQDYLRQSQGVRGILGNAQLLLIAKDRQTAMDKWAEANALLIELNRKYNKHSGGQ